jgi:hypothetical protein
MRISRYLDVQSFLAELRDLRIFDHPPSATDLERLERQRILIPRLRLRYPDEIERRWYADNYSQGTQLLPLEPDGPRWSAANSLEICRTQERWIHAESDPLNIPHGLDDPLPEWKNFIQNPESVDFIAWDNYKVEVSHNTEVPIYTNRTAITYYSSWQVLQYFECISMGILVRGNLSELSGISDPVPESFQRSVSGLPPQAMHKFIEHKNTLDAVVWFAEETSINQSYVIRPIGGRRILDKTEIDQIDCRTAELASRCKARFGVVYQDIIKLSKFLAAQWGHWDSIGQPRKSQAYKEFLSKSLALAQHLESVDFDKMVRDIGQVTGHFKPTLRVIFNDWATEWREDAERLLQSFSRPDALLKAEFTVEQVNAFLDFVEQSNLFEFYWRWRSFYERAFANDSKRLAGMKSDLQGMALSVEHIVDALLRPHIKHLKPQLFEKFKQIWANHSDIGKLLRADEYRQIAFQKEKVDLGWFEDKQGDGSAEKIASDLAICHAIRGNVHSAITETNQLHLERMSLILLRGVLQAFIFAQAKWQS